MLASVITLGCKVNEYESQSILGQLKDYGYDITEGYEVADVYVVNTCAVTNVAERKSRQVMAKLLKLNPNAKIVVCGCAVQNNPSQFLKNKNVLALVGNAGKEHIMDFIGAENKTLPDLEHFKYTDMHRPIETRTRQFIKIQDGCNYFCSYCLIPYVRGRSRSRDLNDILDEIRSTTAKEIVLTGINMSDYRIEGEVALKTLIREIDKLGKRFRLSSIECNVLDDEMLNILAKSNNFCPHFHLSLQSACNATLKRMNRRYTIEEFIAITDKIKAIFPRVCLSTDIIVGFKGETDDEFAETLKNVKRIGFTSMHVFPYSERSGTNACKLSGDVPTHKIKERLHTLLALRDECTRQFIRDNENTTHTVLIEEYDGEYSVGYTENYIYTYILGKQPIGDILTVTLGKPYKNGQLAELKGE